MKENNDSIEKSLQNEVNLSQIEFLSDETEYIQTDENLTEELLISAYERSLIEDVNTPQNNVSKNSKDEKKFRIPNTQMNMIKLKKSNCSDKLKLKSRLSFRTPENFSNKRNHKVCTKEN